MKARPPEFSRPDPLTGSVIAWYEYEDEGESLADLGDKIREIHGDVEIAYFNGFARVTVRTKWLTPKNQTMKSKREGS